MGCASSKGAVVVSSQTPSSKPAKQATDDNNNKPNLLPPVKEESQRTKEIKQSTSASTLSLKDIRNRKKQFIDAQKFLNLSYEEASKLHPKDIDEMWAIVKKTSDKEPIQVAPTKNRKGWRTIRIFVSSTFKDFHQEREVLVKEVFPDLRLWCEERKLRLVECDLRWGVPKDSTTEETIKICLSELDRCYEDNVAPFFLNLAGERAGWIPNFGDLTNNLAAQYGWIYGLSVTEMEIVHGAFRKLNPNALFLLREPDSIKDLPDIIKNDFLDDNDNCIDKLKTLKTMISEQFQENCVYRYKVEGVFSHGKVEFKGLSGDSQFSQKVYDFFKTRIEELYPLDPSPLDPLQVQKEAHETFLDSRSQCVLGRDKIIEQIKNYAYTDDGVSPLLVIGTAGAGKSALMAKCAADTVYMASENKLTVPSGFKKWRVFFHFVGATPGSTDLAFFLQRLTKEVKPDMKDIVSDLETLIQLSNSLLSNPNTEPIILFIDAVNQLDEDKQQFMSRWLPDNLSPNVRVIVSMIESTPSHQMLRSYKPSPVEVMCGPLDMDSRKEIVCNILKMYNKRLDDEQLNTLVAKEGSSNPLWLTLACEELRVFGKFEELIGKIETLPDDLIDLEIDVFSRFETETGGLLMKATLCLLEVSRHGLLETELLALLGDDNNIKCPDYVEGEEEEVIKKTEEVTVQSIAPLDTEKEDVENLTDKFSKLVDDAYVIKEEGEDKKEKAHRPKGKQVNFLPARDWAIIYRNLKQLLRPCGDLGEGRLDFYHRSLSKAVRRKYFQGSEGFKKHMYNFWHGVLAGYFEGVDDMDRKAEELPYHLEQLLDNNRLIRCLLEWPVFNRLYNEDFSIDLLRSWQKAGGYAVASALYKESLIVLKDSGMPLIEFAEQMEKVAMFLIQAGQYTEAYEILEERVKHETEQLGSRVDELADIYQMMAKCKSEVVKNYNFVTMSQLEEDEEVVELCRKSHDYRKELQGEDHEFKMALNNVLLCHHLAIIADLKNDDTYRIQAFEVVNEAISVFQKINDIGHLAEAIMTKSFVNPRAKRYFEEKKNELEKAFELCLKAYGKGHMLYVRLCLNIGILYEDDRQFGKAYDYFVQWDVACKEVLGPSHPKAIRAKDTLNEPMYKRMREQRERTAAGTA
ncbi:TPR repeat-containing protein DDB_G0287407-like isoform X1 [Hydractinia symbiolongicarpus]|uniref:TPR repeat-containing protein DDB_G0287407-like isoform X1 n=2 Tax=Hydractinia symbiolongicarpus TaxID=13093 RepID=UPI0025506E40|nr:TPR repeat-containing protein DDB_G0287407-like isoform X1 [Hydractinia symbiolongicarpus]